MVRTEEAGGEREREDGFDFILETGVTSTPLPLPLLLPLACHTITLGEEENTSVCRER